MPYLIAFGVLVAILAGLSIVFLIILKRQKKRRKTLYSIVGLLEEPFFFDTDGLTRAVEKAWGVNLSPQDGDAATEGFIVGETPIQTIKWRDDFYLVHSFNRPYVDDPEAFSQSIVDGRLRSLIANHKAWFAVDFLLGAKAVLDEAGQKAVYQKLGRLFAQLVDNRCQVILLPQFSQGFPINADTEKALLSEDPPRELQATLSAPIIEVQENDPEMKAAVESARREWPKFVEHFEAKRGEAYVVKAPVRHDQRVEFIWIDVTAVEGDRIYGTLANQPFDLGPLNLGSKVSVSAAELNDWTIRFANGEIVGAFTLKAIQNAAKRRQEGT